MPQSASTYLFVFALALVLAFVLAILNYCLQIFDSTKPAPACRTSGRDSTLLGDLALLICLLLIVTTVHDLMYARTHANNNCITSHNHSMTSHFPVMIVSSVAELGLIEPVI